VRMGLFIAVTLYACLMLQLLEPRPRAPRKPGVFSLRRRFTNL